MRLIDKSIVCGKIVFEDDYYTTLENVVELGTKPLNAIAGLEQQYYFKGMYSPFSASDKIITELPREAILTINSDLDPYFEQAYYKYTNDWFTIRQKANTNMLKGDPKIPSNKEPKSENTDMLEAMLESIYLANNEIH